MVTRNVVVKWLAFFLFRRSAVGVSSWSQAIMLRAFRQFLHSKEFRLLPHLFRSVNRCSTQLFLISATEKSDSGTGMDSLLAGHTTKKFNYIFQWIYLTGLRFRWCPDVRDGLCQTFGKISCVGNRSIESCPSIRDKRTLKKDMCPCFDRDSNLLSQYSMVEDL
jgi:hypothetical protein